MVCDVREIFRGDSKKTKGPEVFKLLKSEMESLETTLRDEEATQTRKTMKFNFTAESGEPVLVPIKARHERSEVRAGILHAQP